MSNYMNIDKKAVNELRCLCADMIQKANSGHPGGPLGMAPMVYVLYTRILKHDPKNPQWPGRDRVILSNGHCSSLLYSILHLCGYDYSMDDLKQFRQLHSKTPGHPERWNVDTNDVNPGIEVSTGPLGQGVANGVGLAIARDAVMNMHDGAWKELADSAIFVFCGDGCL